MISWINGELVESWQTNQKFFVLINCQGLGYEIQILESFFLKLKTNQISNKKITLWLKHIKKEDSDLLFGFSSKEQRNFFIEILSIRGVGSQIGMGILNKFSISEIINAIKMLNKNNVKINEKNLSNMLYTKHIPDPDMLIRTGNTKRLSNFLLWQLSYSEIFFSKKLWPEFRSKDFLNIISQYKKIKRNFGKI